MTVGRSMAYGMDNYLNTSKNRCSTFTNQGCQLQLLWKWLRAYKLVGMGLEVLEPHLLFVSALFSETYGRSWFFCDCASFCKSGAGALIVTADKCCLIWSL